MKRFLFFAVAAVLFAACSKDAINEQQGIQNIVDEAPATLTVGFEDDETRIQLNEAQKTVWTNGDLVSVFYRSNANQQWQYTGETGARTADLTRVNAGEATKETQRVVVVYPYNANYYFNTETYNVQASLPATQTYLKDSYGLDGNIMISQSEYNNISLKNVCGWLKLQLTGNGEQVKSITVRGNNGEQVAGELYINSADATATLASEAGDAGEDEGENETGGAGGNLVFEDTVLTEVTLNCLDGTSPTEKGVALGAEATSFYIALPPQTFTKGITVDITATNGLVMTKSTDNEVVIERNHIKPMSAFAADLPVPETWKIYYTATAKVEPYLTYVFGATYLSNVWDSETGKGVITFEGNVTTIGEKAFYNCDSLTSVNIPDSVTTIGTAAFYCCSLTSVTIPNSVTKIGSRAFNDCRSLASVTIGDSVTKIGGGAFEDCTSLKEFKGKFAADNGRCLIMDNTIIAYANASGTTYNIPDSVTTIGSSAFHYCRSLTSVTIPESVTTIGVAAFYDCISLATVYCKPTTPPTGGYNMFTGNASGRKIYVPAGSEADYKEKQYWSEYKDYIFEEGPANNEIWYTTTDGAVAEFYFGVSNITPMPTQYYNEEQNCWVVKFDESCMSGGMPNPCGFALFTDSSNARITTLKFSENDRLFDFVVNGGGDWDPRSMTSLREINVPNYITKLDTSEYSYTGVGTFQDCTSLETITLSNKLTVIGNNTFFNCSSLTSITIPDSVTTIGTAAFYCCSLTSVTIPNSVTTIGGYAFHGCSSLKSVTLGEGLDNLKNFGVFMRCRSLEEIIIPSNITEIHKETFQNCDRLHTIYCKRETPPAYGYSNLAHVNIEKIYVPASGDDSIINAYKAAEGWSEYKDYIFEEE